MATIRLTPSTYSVSNSSYLSVSNASNMYNNTDNTTYATITNSRSSTSSYYLYIKGFNFDDIPSGATINSFAIKIKVRESGVTTSSSYRMYLCNNTTTTSDYASTMPSTSAATITFDNMSSDWNTLVGYGSNLGIRINCRRARRNTTGYMYVYGAEIEVDYSLPYAVTTTITNGTLHTNTSITASAGDDVLINFDPYDGYEFKLMTINGVAVTPTYTSKAKSAITVKYSTNYSTYSSYAFTNCYDGSTSTYFWSSEAQTTGKYVLITFSAAVDLDSFQTYSSNSTDYPNTNNYLQVSSDGGTTWTDIGAFSASTTTTFSNIGASGINAVRIYAKSDISNWLVINEITMSYSAHQSVVYGYSYTITSIDEDKNVIIVCEKELTDVLYVKENGEWVIIKKFYQKANGAWILLGSYVPNTGVKLIHKA